MERLELMIRNIAIGLALLILYPITVKVALDILNPKPEQSHCVTRTDETVSGKEELTVDLALYNAKIARYRTIFFYTFVLGGILAMAGGGCIRVPFVGLGFILGGAISLMVGYISYWDMLKNITQLLSLIIALVLLVFAGYWHSDKHQ